jgi:hypothetical protein
VAAHNVLVLTGRSPSLADSHAKPRAMHAVATPKGAIAPLWLQTGYTYRFWPNREATVGLGHGRPCGHFQPVGQDLNRNPFPFHFGLNSSLNLENLYLPIQSSKNYETRDLLAS